MKHLQGNKYLCPVCKGKGTIYNHAAGIFTFGLAYLLQASDPYLKERCDRCNGKGFIEI